MRLSLYHIFIRKENRGNEFKLKISIQELDALACSLTKGINLNKDSSPVIENYSDDGLPEQMAEFSSVDSEPLDFLPSMVFPGAISDGDGDSPSSKSKQ